MRWTSWPPLPLSRRGQGLFAALVCCLVGFPVGARLWDLTSRLADRTPILFNEGWNAYYSHAAAVGEPLYGAPPDFAAVSYPPVFFHLAGALGGALGSQNLAGRLLSLVCALWVALCAASIARRLSGDRWAAALAALFCVGWTAFFAPGYVGSNEPQMLGHAFILTAAALYAWRMESAPVLGVACVLCCAGGFVKPNLIAFPVAIGIDMALRSPRRFALWGGGAALTLVALYGLTVWADGPYMIQHVLSARGYSATRAVFVSGIFVRLFLPALAICALWCLRVFRRPAERFLALTLPISLLAAVFFSGGSGVYVNVFFDSLIALSIISAVVVSGLAQRAGPGTLKWCAVTALVPLLFSAGPFVGGFRSPVTPSQAQAVANRVFAEDAAYLRSRPGPALCLNLLLCYEAGKPLIYDPYTSRELMAAGRLDPRRVAAEIAAGKFASIQFWNADGPATAIPETLVAAVKSSYRIERRSPQGVFYIPAR